MSRTQHLRALANDPGATDGERAAARRALGIHEHKLQTAIQESDPEPPGPDITRRGGPFPARDHDGRVWVAVRDGEAVARGWVVGRCRLLVRLDGRRQAMVPTDVEVDDERGQVYVTASADAITEW